MLTSELAQVRDEVGSQVGDVLGSLKYRRGWLQQHATARLNGFCIEQGCTKSANSILNRVTNSVVSRGGPADCEAACREKRNADEIQQGVRRSHLNAGRVS